MLSVSLLIVLNISIISLRYYVGIKMIRVFIQNFYSNKTNISKIIKMLLKLFI